jgi:hypothetical protein
MTSGAKNKEQKERDHDEVKRASAHTDLSSRQLGISPPGDPLTVREPTMYIEATFGKGHNTGGRQDIKSLLPGKLSDIERKADEGEGWKGERRGELAGEIEPDHLEI